MPQPKKQGERIFSLTGYILILVCFALPFMKISCGGVEMARLTGYELAFGENKQSTSSSIYKELGIPEPSGSNTESVSYTHLRAHET